MAGGAGQPIASVPEPLLRDERGTRSITPSPPFFVPCPLGRPRTRRISDVPFVPFCSLLCSLQPFTSVPHRCAMNGAPAQLLHRSLFFAPRPLARHRTRRIRDVPFSSPFSSPAGERLRPFQLSFFQLVSSLSSSVPICSSEFVIWINADRMLVLTSCPPLSA